jgi:spore maturation protein CgeB
MKVIYSFNKRGFEAALFEREINGASTDQYQFIPFNHDPYLDVSRYLRAQLLDNLYFAREPGLMRLYSDVSALIRETGADALLVDNCFPYHPEFLRKLDIFKVMRTTDGPIVAYDRDFAYVHAYDQVLYHSPAYSPEMDMDEKLRYLGAKDARFWPLAVFESMYDHSADEESVRAARRDVDIVFVGTLHRNKMPMLAKVKKAFGKRFSMRGVATTKLNAYYNLKFGLPGWVRPLPFDEYVPLYQRARIGINLHNRGDFTVGSYRLFELPANGVMQISDGGRHLDAFFKRGKEIVDYVSAGDLIDKIGYYLEHESERDAIAMAGRERVMRDHRFPLRLRQAGEMIADGIRLKAQAQSLSRSSG